MGDTFERVDTLRDDPRDDIPMAHRMKRFVEALQIRRTSTLSSSRDTPLTSSTPSLPLTLPWLF